MFRIENEDKGHDFFSSFNKKKKTPLNQTKKFNEIDFSGVDLIAPLKKKFDFLNAKKEKNQEDTNRLEVISTLLFEFSNKMSKKTSVYAEGENQADVSTLAQQLRAVKLRKVNTGDKTQQELYQTSRKGNDLPVLFTINPEDLNKGNLKFVNRENQGASSHSKSEPSELEKKFSEIKERKKVKNNTSIDILVTEKNTLKEVTEQQSPIVSNFNTVRLSEKTQKRIDSKLAKFGPFLNSEELGDMEFLMLEKEASRLTVIEEGDESRVNLMTLDELLQSLQAEISALDNKIKEAQAPIGFHFNNALDQDKPAILEAVFKPKK